MFGSLLIGQTTHLQAPKPLHCCWNHEVRYVLHYYKLHRWWAKLVQGNQGKVIKFVQFPVFPHPPLHSPPPNKIQMLFYATT